MKVFGVVQCATGKILLDFGYDPADVTYVSVRVRVTTASAEVCALSVARVLPFVQFAAHM